MAADRPTGEGTLFTNENGPLLFYVPICDTGPQLRNVIKAGGGKIVEQPKRDVNVLHLVPKGSAKLRSCRGTAVSEDWMRACVEHRFLLPWENFEASAEAPAGSSATGGPAPGGPAPGGPSVGAAASASRAAAAPSHPAPCVGPARHGGRLHFTAEDDAALIRWVHASGGRLKPQGQQLWMEAERARITQHSWASMQNRWRRQLKGRRPPPDAGRAARAVASRGTAAGADAAAGGADAAARGSASGKETARPAPAAAGSPRIRLRRKSISQFAEVVRAARREELAAAAPATPDPDEDKIECSSAASPASRPPGRRLSCRSSAATSVKESPRHTLSRKSSAAASAQEGESKPLKRIKLEEEFESLLQGAPSWILGAQDPWVQVDVCEI